MLHRRPQSSACVALVRRAQVELGDIRLTTGDAGKIVDVNEVLFLGGKSSVSQNLHPAWGLWGLFWGCFHGWQTRNHDNNRITLRLSGTRMGKEPGIGMVPTCFLAYQWSNRTTCNSLLSGCWFCRKWIKLFCASFTTYRVVIIHVVPEILDISITILLTAMNQKVRERCLRTSLVDINIADSPHPQSIKNTTSLFNEILSSSNLATKNIFAVNNYVVQFPFKQSSIFPSTCWVS